MLLMVLWIRVDVTDNCIYPFLKCKQNKNVNIDNFVYHEKTRLPQAECGYSCVGGDEKTDVTKGTVYHQLT